MKLKNVIEGIEILRPHYLDPDGFNITAMSEQIVLFSTGEPLSEDEVKKLKDLGWCQDVTNPQAPYDPAELWIALV